jgi:hypothetical protein
LKDRISKLKKLRVEEIFSLQNHLAWKANGTTSARGVATGVESFDGAGEFLHNGHVAFIFSHPSIQSAWKQ